MDAVAETFLPPTPTQKAGGKRRAWSVSCCHLTFRTFQVLGYPILVHHLMYEDVKFYVYLLNKTWFHK